MLLIKDGSFAAKCQEGTGKEERPTQETKHRQGTGKQRAPTDAIIMVASLMSFLPGLAFFETWTYNFCMHLHMSTTS